MHLGCDGDGLSLDQQVVERQWSAQLKNAPLVLTWSRVCGPRPGHHGGAENGIQLAAEARTALSGSVEHADLRGCLRRHRGRWHPDHPERRAKPPRLEYRRYRRRIPSGSGRTGTRLWAASSGRRLPSRRRGGWTTSTETASETCWSRARPSRSTSPRTAFSPTDGDASRRRRPKRSGVDGRRADKKRPISSGWRTSMATARPTSPRSCGSPRAAGWARGRAGLCSGTGEVRPRMMSDNAVVMVRLLDLDSDGGKELAAAEIDFGVDGPARAGRGFGGFRSADDGQWTLRRGAGAAQRRGTGGEPNRDSSDELETAISRAVNLDMVTTEEERRSRSSRAPVQASRASRWRASMWALTRARTSSGSAI